MRFELLHEEVPLQENFLDDNISLWCLFSYGN